MATKFNPITYSKNLAKSLGYATFDAIIGDTVFKDAYDENKDSVSEIYQNIRNFAKDPKNTIRNSEFAKEYSPIIKDGFKNLMDDIKSGNIYNKDRADQAMFDSMFGGEEGGFDFDFDDFEDSSSFEEEPITDGSSALATKAQTIATGQNIKAMDIVGKTTAKAINTTTARSAQYLAQAQQASTQLILKQQTKLFNQVSVGLAGVNQSLGSLVSLGEPLTAHMQNSMKFYTETSQKLDKMISLLEGVSKAVTPAQQQGTNRSYKGIDSYLTSSGAISLSGMKEMLGRNFGRAIDSSPLGMLTGFQIGEDGKGLWKQMAANPLGTALSLALPNLLPKAFTDSIDKLGKSLAGFNVELIKRLSKMNGNPVKDFIGSLFGYDDTLNTKIDTSKYNKGKVDFDGKARKAIIEVIPTYLSKILAALTGGFETRFDYDKGRFVNRQQIQEQYREIFSREAKSIGYDVADTDDIRTSYYKSSGGQTKLSRSQAEKIQKDFNKYVENAIKTNNIIDPRKLNSLTDEDAKKYGFKDKAMMKNVIELYQSYMKSGDSHRLMALTRSINQARLSISASFDDMNGDNVLGNLFNGGFEDYIHGGMPLAALGIGSSGKRGSSNQKRQRANEYYQKNANRKKYRIEFSHRELERRYGDKKIPKAIEDEWKELFSDSSFASNKERQDFIDRINESTGYSEDRFPGIDESTGFEYDASATGIRKIAQTAKRIVQSPLSVVTSILNKADKTLFEVLYGKVDKEGNVIDDDGHRSVLGIMFNNMKDMFTTFKDWMKDNIFNPIRKFFDDRGGFKGMISSIFGIDVDVAMGMAKDKAREIAGNVGQNFKSVGKWAWNKLKTVPGEFGFGSGSGLISAASYYGGGAFGRYDDNTVIQAFKAYKNGASLSEVASQFNIKIKDLTRIFSKHKSIGDLMDSIHRGAQGERAANTRRKIQKVREGTANFFEDPNALGTRTLQAGSDMIHRVVSEIFPEKDLSETGKKAKSVVKESMDALGLDPSGAITGALMGGGLSILSGGIISPMIAASIGAAAGLVIKSDNVQDALFGKMDPKTKERDGSGLLTKQMTDFLTKKLPSVAGFSLAGGLAGLLPIVPGGPIGGLVLGAGIGFAKKSETVQEFLYGDSESGTSGILGTTEDKQKRIDFIKRMAPKAILGAALGAVAGPFGFVGNLMGGAALGFASETKTFQETMFGKEEVLLGDDGKPVMENGKPVMVRSGGIFGWLRKGIISPLEKAIKPIASEIKFNTKKMIRHIGRIIGDVFAKHVGKPLWATAKHYLSPLWKIVSKPIKWIGDIVAAPFKALGDYGTHLKNKQVRQGRADYMSASERINYRLTSDYGAKEDDFLGFDAALAAMDTTQLATMRANITGASKLKNKKIRVANGKLRAVIDRFYSISYTAGITAYDMLNDPDSGKTPADVFEALRTRKKNPIEISEKDKIEINNLYADYEQSKVESEASNTTFKNYLDDLKEQLKLDKNIKVDEKNFQQYLDMVKAEQHFRENGVEKVTVDLDAARNKILEAHKEITKAKLTDILNTVINIGHAIPGFKNVPLHSGGTGDYDRNLEKGPSLTEQVGKTDNQYHAEIMSDYTDYLEGQGSGLVSARRWYRRFRGRGVSEDVGGEYIDPLTGESLSYTKTDSGEMIADIGDAGNRKAERKRQAFFGKFDRIGDGIHSVNETLIGIKDKLFGNKEKQEPGLFEKLKNGLSNLLFGGEGLLSGLFGFLTGKSMGGLVGKLLAKFNLKAALPWIGSALGIKLFGDAVAGKFDTFFSGLGWSDPNKKEIITGSNGENLATVRKATAEDVRKASAQGTTIQIGDLVYTNAEGKIVSVTRQADGQVLKEGDKVDQETGQLYRGNVEINSGGTQTMSNLARKSIVHSIGTGKGTAALLAKKAVDTVKSGRIAKSIAKQIGKVDALDDVVIGVYTIVSKALGWLVEKFPRLSPLADKVDNIAAKLAEKVADKVSGEAAEKAAKVLANAAVITKVALVVADFTTGYEDARTTLGIVDEPTPGQRIISGLLRALKNCIPIVDLIPDSLIVDVLVDYVGPIFGLDPAELKAKRNSAKDTVEQYNKEHGTNIASVEEYNKSVLHDYTWTERIGNAAKETAVDIRNKTRMYSDLVSANGFMEGTKMMLKSQYDSFRKDQKEKGLGVALQNLLPGFFGDFAKAKVDITKFAAKGDLKGLWGVELDSFGGGTDSNGDGVVEAEAGIFSKIIGQVPLLMSKMTATPGALISLLFHKLNIGAIFDKIKTAWNQSVQGGEQLNKFVQAGDVQGLVSSSQPEDPENPVGGFVNGMYNVSKIFMVPMALTKSIGMKIKEKFDKVFGVVKSSVGSIVRSKQDIMNIAITGDYQRLWDYNPAGTIQEDNPIGGFVHGINIVQKLFGFPHALIANIGKAIKDKFNETVNKVKLGWNIYQAANSKVMEYVVAGQPKELFESTMEVDDANPVGGILSGVYNVLKIINTPPAFMRWTSNKIRDKFNEIIGKVKIGWDQSVQGGEQINKFVQAGDVEGLINSSQPEDPENPVGGFINGVYNVTKILMVPTTYAKKVGNKIFDTVKSKIDGVKNNVDKMSSEFDKMSQYAQNGNVKEIWTSTGVDFDMMSVTGPFMRFITVMGKVMYTFIGLARKLMNPIGEAADAVGKKVEGAKDWVIDKKDEAVNKVKEGVSSVKNFVMDHGVGHLIYGSDYKNIAATDPRYQAGSGSFVSQTSSALANKRFGGSTFGENGCAPAVASMLTGMPVGSTAGYALGGGYTNNAGTSADYFGNLFAQNGISSEYVFTGAGSAQDYLASRISSGHPTVLLGQDYSNTSKANSPFGPGNHYVLATGTDSRGNIIVQDPEASRPNITYDRSILNSVKLGIPTGGSSKIVKFSKKTKRNIISRFGFRGRGALNGITTEHKMIWTYLTKTAGLTQEGAAGLMGCWQAESSCSPQRVEADYLHDSFPGYDAILKDANVRNQWAQTIKAKTRNYNVNLEAYKGQDGNYYPGIGLAQWTGPRGYNLFAYAQEKGENWGCLRTQLDFVLREFKTTKSAAYAKLKSVSDVTEATKVAFHDYEGAKVEDNRFTERLGYANIFYNELSGRTFTIPKAVPAGETISASSSSATTPLGTMSSGSTGSSGSAGVYSSTGTSSAGESKSGSTSSIASLPSLFGKLFTSAMGGLGKLFGFSSDDENSGEDEYSQENNAANALYTPGSSNSSVISGKNGYINGSDANDFPYFNQGDEPWASQPYGSSGTIKSAGCGPTSMAMIMRSYGINTDPSQTAQWSVSHGHRVPGVGTGWGFFKDIGNENGLEVQQTSSADAAKQMLYNNIPVIGSMKPGDFTTGGHYIVFSKADKQGTVWVNDPGSRERTKRSWNIDSAFSQSKQFWGITKDGEGSIGKYGKSAYGDGMRNYGDYMRNKETSRQASLARSKAIASSTNYGEYMNAMNGSGSGLYNVAQAGYNTINRQHAHARSVFGGGSGVVNLSKLSESSRNRYISALKQYAGSGSMGNEAMMALIKGIISLLSNVSANSDQIKEAVVVLNKILEATSNGSAGTTNNTTNISAGDLNVDDTDNTIREMQQLLNNLAAGA